jgi:hypothetical protein
MSERLSDDELTRLHDHVLNLYRMDQPDEPPWVLWMDLALVELRQWRRRASVHYAQIGERPARAIYTSAGGEHHE